jgi:hypothetical protein
MGTVKCQSAEVSHIKFQQKLLQVLEYMKKGFVQILVSESL